MNHIVRISYFDSDKSALLLGALEPLTRALAQRPDVEATWIRPHWRFGPHVDLHVQCPAEVFNDTVLPQARQALEAWLANHPSATVLDPQQYERQSVMLGKAEKVPGPYLPLSPNNTVWTDSVIPAPMMGLQELGALRDAFLARTLPLVFELLRLRHSDQQRFFLTVAQMMVCVTEMATPGGTRIGHLSFRAHAEAFVSTYENTRAEFDRFSRSLAAPLKEALVPLLDEFASADRLPSRDPLLSAFCAVLADFLPLVRGVIAEQYDGMQLKVGKETAENAGNPIFEAMRSDRVGAFIKEPGYVAYRVLINFFYLLIPILSVTPAQRFCLCHIVADACQDIFDIDWKNIFFPNKVEN